jgi:hypothetical protein
MDPPPSPENRPRGPHAAAGCRPQRIVETTFLNKRLSVA